MRKLHDGKEVRCDIFVISLYNLQIHYLTEIKRGYCNTGSQYNLKDQYKLLAENPGDILLPVPISPSKVFDQIRQNLRIKDEIPEVLASSSQQQIPKKCQIPIASQMEKARQVVKDSRIRHVEGFNVFVVISEDLKTKNITSLFPEDCTCRASSVCYHLLATKILMGAPITEKKQKVITLAKLSRRGKKNSDKKSGQKKPRKLDVDDVGGSTCCV